jgi:ribose transport system substrate-binding protein
VSGPLKQAAAAHIPVIDSLNGDPNQPLTDGVRAHVTVNYTLGGKLMADYVAANSKGNGQVIIFTSSIYTIYQAMLKGFRQELKARCPKCRIDAVENVQPTQVGTELGTITSTALSRFPQAHYLVPFYDAMVTYMIPAIRQVGSHAVIISHDGVNTNLNLIRQGDVQVADVSNPPTPSMGWAEVDELGRLMAGQPAVFENLPQQIFVRANLGKKGANLFPGYANYPAKYEALWGVKP